MFSSQKSFFLPISLLYICVFAVSGPMVMFYPVFMDSRGMGSEEIGYAMSAMSFGKLISVLLMAFIIDKSRKPQLFLVGTAFFGLVVLAVIYGFSLMGNILILMSFFFSLAWSVSVPLCEGFTMRACRLQSDLDYSRVRLFGSASFMFVGNLTGYLIGLYSIDMFIWVVLFASFSTAMISYHLPNFYALEKNNLIITDKIVDAQSIRQMLAANIPLIVIIIGVSIMHSGHAVLFQHAPNQWLKDGYSHLMVSMFLGFGIVAELAVFWSGKKINTFLRPQGYLLIAGVGSAIRWFAMTFDLSTEMIFFFQSFHAFTFAALHLGVIRFIRENLQGHYHGAAQLIYSGCMWGLFMIPAAASAGHLYKIFGNDAYFFMSALAVLGTIITMIPFVFKYFKTCSPGVLSVPVSSVKWQGALASKK